ncbi:MAG TPA: aldo/keto reductase [Phaeodactylibacter sp.]|nr:aldo/keto reductase [Phaeodactylibacter sp.]
MSGVALRHRDVQPYLGTAFWGWRIATERCFELLNAFYECGFRYVDTATNYPIDKQPEHFRLAESILQQWIRAHGVGDLRICQKVGSLNNTGGPEHLLNPSFLLLNATYYRNKFGSNLHCLMWHWDKRRDEEAIAKSLEVAADLVAEGIAAGFSGLEHPAIHASHWFEREVSLPEDRADDFSRPYLQLKHNLFQSAYSHYAPFHGRARFIAYGITAGGLKFGESRMETLRARGGQPQKFRRHLDSLQQYLAEAFPRQTFTFHELGMIYASFLPGLSGLLLGASNTAQLEHSLSFWQGRDREHDRKIYEALLAWKKSEGL